MVKIARQLASIISRSQTATNIADFLTRSEALMNTVTSRYPLGSNIYEQDWDLLIILDTCRVDAIRSISDEYDFIDNVDSIFSVGSCSREWIQKTFVEEYRTEIRNTTYVTANPWARRVLADNNYLEKGWPRWSTLSIEDLGYVENVWETREKLKKRAHPEGTAAPEFVTNSAIELARKQNPDRMIVHYVPPHHSYVSNSLDGKPLKPHERDPFHSLRNGNSREAVWDAYIDELRWALEWVNILISNVDAPKAIITSDHGEAFGEYGRYMHDPGLLDPNVKIAPWVQTTAKNTENRDIQLESADDKGLDTEVEDQLHDMGYLS